MRYDIKALDKTRVLALSLDAADLAEARRQVEEQGLRWISARPRRSLLSGLSWRRTERFDLVLFSQELTTLLHAGLPLVDALESLTEKAETPLARKILEALVKALYDGQSLSQALGRNPAVFPPLYVALVQASEKTGDVGDALGRYIAYRQRMDLVREKIVSASIYPALLLIVGGGVMLFLMGYVVPRFSLVFEGLGDNLPWLSRMLMQGGLFLHHYQLELACGAAALVGGALLARRQPWLRRLGQRVLQQVPALQQRLTCYELARFYRSLGILLQGGIPILTALSMVRGLLGAGAATALDAASAQVRDGQALSDALQAQQLATPVSLRLLRAGEGSGNVGYMMERAADFHDEELNRWIDRFVRMFEPVLMAVIGLLIGGIVVLMYMPIFELASSIR